MAAITATSAVAGAFTVTSATLTSSDTLTFDPKKKQLLLVRNGTGSPVTLNIDGDGIDSVTVAGLGAVDVSGGLDITIADGVTKAVALDTIKHYCQGVVTLTGASGCIAQLVNL